MPYNLMKAKAKGLLKKVKKLPSVKKALDVLLYKKVIVYCDEALFESDTIKITGWALSKDAVDRVEVSIDGKLTGVAALGVTRIDLALAYPEIEDSKEGGFSFFKHLDEPLQPGRHVASITAISKAGDFSTIKTRFKLTEKIESQTSETDFTVHANCEKTIVNLDYISVSGWAFSSCDIKSIQIYIDDTLVGNAKYKLTRGDVSRKFPGYKNSLLSGFCYRDTTETNLSQGTHTLEIRAVTEHGVITCCSKTVTITERYESVVKNSPPEIMLHYDNLILGTGVIYIYGWALSENGIAALEVYIDKVYAGEADFVTTRADVRSTYQCMENIEKGCFCFMKEFEKPIPAGKHVVTLRAVSSCEFIKEINIEQQAAKQYYHLIPAIAHGVYEEFESNLCIDKVYINGWAFSDDGIKNVDLYIDGEFTDKLIFGLERPDVESLLPCKINALKSGMCILKDLTNKLSKGSHCLTLRILTNSGYIKETSQFKDVSLTYGQYISSSANTPEINIHFDSELCTDKVYVNGWAFSNDGIKDVELYINGEFIDKLTLGLERMDVAMHFPCKTNTLESGMYLLREPKESMPKGTYTATLKVLTNGGFVKEFSQITEVSQTFEQYLRENLFERLLFIDSASITSRHLHVVGWAVFPNGISDVEILVDDIVYGRVVPVLSRPDVARSFQGYEDVMNCGFSFNIGLLTPLDDVNHTVTVRAKSKDGLINEKRCATRSDSYFEYLSKLEIPTVKMAQNEMKRFSYNPKFSVITPVYNVEPQWLNKCIESVLNQLYENWELCLYDDASTAAETLECLRGWEGKDKRIKISYGKKNLHIAGASNEALRLATGDFIAPLDNDDELAPHALLEFAKLLNDNPELDFIYSDEDKLDEEGRRDVPFFKPDWSLFLFLSMMFTGHLSAYRKSVVDKIGGYREGFDGSQDYDMTLRFIEQTSPKRIAHIPEILYHWRMIHGSVASASESKHYAYENAKTALTQYLQRNSIDADVEFTDILGCYRLRHHLRIKPKISIIIPTKDKVEYISVCVSSILEKTTYDNYEIIVVDTGSVDESTFNFYGSVKDNPKLKIVQFERPEFNYSDANNFGVNNSTGEVLLFLNNDTEVINGNWLEHMVGYAMMDKIGVVGSKLLYPDDTIQHMGVVVGISGGAAHICKHYNDKILMGSPFHHAKDLVRDVTAVTGACLMVRRAVYDEVNGFDPDFKIAFNDIDFCLKIWKAGYTNIYTPHARLYHHESISVGTLDETHRNKSLFVYEVDLLQSRWNVRSFKDPYHNPHLKHDFSITL